MESDRVRLKLLARLGIRDETAFFPLSNGGPAAIDVALHRLATAGVVGDYLEFGVFRGYTLWYAQQAADRCGLQSMRFFGFDSFEGLPDVVGTDRKAGIFISGDYKCTMPDVARLLTEHGFDWERATLIEGYFDSSLTSETKASHHIVAAALVMIDCDLYQSTVPVLNFLDGLLQDGTILLFDDWRCFGGAPDQGEVRAFREFMARHPEWRAEPLMEFPRYGAAFVMRFAGQPAEPAVPSDAQPSPP